MFDLIVKLFLTPENIIGIIFNTLNILTFCFIFKELKEKWWKSLIPIYSTYILYKHLWKYTSHIPLGDYVGTGKFSNYF